MQENAKLTSNALVSQSNTLISAHYEMTELERKILLASMSIINPNSDTNFYKIRFYLNELASYIGIAGSNIKEIKRAAKAMASRVVSIENGNDWTITHWVSEISCRDKVIEITFNETLAPHLLNLKQMFTTIPVKDLIELKGKYSSRLYELLYQYIKIGKREFKIEELRLMLGVGETEYPDFKNFRRKVIDKAISEIHNSGKMAITVSYKKTGRYYSHIIFTMTEGPVIAFPEVIEQATAEAFTDIIGKTVALAAIERYGLEYCLANLKYVYEQKPKSRKSYLKKAIELNYAKHEGTQNSLFDKDEMPCEFCQGKGFVSEIVDGIEKVTICHDCRSKKKTYK